MFSHLNSEGPNGLYKPCTTCSLLLKIYHDVRKKEHGNSNFIIGVLITIEIALLVGYLCMLWLACGSQYDNIFLLTAGVVSKKYHIIMFTFIFQPSTIMMLWHICQIIIIAFCYTTVS